MVKSILALGVAATALTAGVPAQARHITGDVTCARWHHHHCVAFRSRYAVGYHFGPSYGYTEYSALPQPLVTRYHLRHDWRYVNQDGYVYVVNPETYRVVRVIPM